MLKLSSGPNSICSISRETFALIKNVDRCHVPSPLGIGVVWRECHFLSLYHLDRNVHGKPERGRAASFPLGESQQALGDRIADKEMWAAWASHRIDFGRKQAFGDFSQHGNHCLRDDCSSSAP